MRRLVFRAIRKSKLYFLINLAIMQSSENNHLTPLDSLMSKLELALIEPDPDYDSCEDEVDTPHKPRSSSSGSDELGDCFESLRPTPVCINQPKAGHVIKNSHVTDSPVLHPGTTELGMSKKQPNGSSSHHHHHQEDDGKKSSNKSALMSKLKIAPPSSNSAQSKFRRRTTLEQLTVDSLPQSLVAKYLGHKDCRGLWGVQYTRDAVDELVSELRLLNKETAAVDRGNDLPLVNVCVTDEGISIELHPRNRSRRPLSDVGLLPLQFVSYAVQDTRYSRIFAFILVREISSRSRSTECHAFLCDSPSAARTLALSVALAFRTCEARLAGEAFRFAVDLRWPDELETELNGDRHTHAAEFEV